MTRLINLVFASGLLLPALVPLRGQTASEAAEAAAFARAQQAEKAGDYRAAERIYQQALTEHPGQMAAELNLGLAYYLERRYADSSAYLLKALHAKPDLFPALMVAGVDLMKLGNPQGAVPFLRHARQLSPENEYVNYNLASAEYLAGNYVQACADYSHYLRLPRQETNVPAWYGLGEVSLLLARRASQQLGKLPVSNPYRLRILVMFYSERQEWGLAVARLRQLEAQPGWREWARLKIDELKKLLRSNPTSEELLQFSGDLLQKGDEQASSDTLAHTPAAPQAVLHSILQARLRAKQGDALGIVDALIPILNKTNGQPGPEADLWISNLFRRAAELALNRVLNLAPNSVDAHLLKAQIDDAHSRTEDAIREFRLAVAAAPDDPDTHFKLGEALWRAGHFQEAISALHQGLGLDPQNAPAYYQIGDSYLSLAKPAQALPVLTEAVKRDPHLSAAYKDLGTIYLSQGKIGQSVAILRKIAARDVDGSVHYMLFRDYSRLGEQTQAAACLKRFQELRKATKDQTLFNAEAAVHQEAKAVVQ